VLCIAKALKTNPLVNSSIIGNELIFWEDINIGCAVAITDVPKGTHRAGDQERGQEDPSADQRELRGAAEKARAASSSPMT